MEPVEKPRERSQLRQRLGKEFYILKRKARWIVRNGDYVRRPSRELTDGLCPHLWVRHRSMLLRPLKDVDMYLQYNKITNLRLATSRIDGVVIRPGERFSIWKLVGRPTARKGYLDGLVLHNGTINKGTGGGLCQLGNLLYWMALHTELDIAERWRHSYDVFPDVNRTIPFACGATLAYNYIDLELQNNSAFTYTVRLWLDEDYLNGEIRCDREPEYAYEVYETDHSIVHQWWGGYTRHNRIRKKRTRLADGTVEDFLISENHAIMMYNPLLGESV